MKKVSILIVDDSQDDRYLLKRQLKGTGLDIKVFEHKHGEDALNFFIAYDQNKRDYPDDFPPMIVFLDINMPIVDGFEFLEKFGPIRKQHNIQSSFIMMFTSSGRKEDKEKAFSYDYVKSYLTKGDFTDEQLKEEILKII